MRSRKGDPAAVGRPARVPVARGVRKAYLTFNGASITRENCQDYAFVLGSERRNTTSVSADVAGAHRRRKTARRRITHSRSFPKRRLFALFFGSRVINKVAGIRGPARMLVIDVISSNLLRCAARQQPHPHMPAAVCRSDECDELPIR